MGSYIKGPRHTKYRFVNGKFEYLHEFDNPRASSWDKEKFGEGAARRRLRQNQWENWHENS